MSAEDRTPDRAGDRAPDRALSPAASSEAPGLPKGTGWPRSPLAQVVRSLLQRLALGPVLNSEVEVESRGVETIAELATSGGPMIIVANHASHLDTPVLLSTLPPEVRRRTVVAAVGGALFDSGWRRQASALVFNAVLLDTDRMRTAGSGFGSRPGGRIRAEDLLADGWNLLIYPEGRRSGDGFLGRFADLAARLAVEQQLPLVPAGVRGTYAVMPRGRPWPIRLGGDDGRSRISVGFGAALRPDAGTEPAELGDRVSAAVKQLIDEDATTWWQAQRHPREPGQSIDPPAGSWRRVWQQTQAPGKGGQPDRARIWPS